MRISQKRGWIWLATATIAVAYLACAQDSLQSARTYAHPVLQFLASHSGEQTAAGAPQPRTLRQSAISAALRSRDREIQSGLWLAMLPVLFVGIVSPLNQLAARFTYSRTPSLPALSALFQRPPPFTRN